MSFVRCVDFAAVCAEIAGLRAFRKIDCNDRRFFAAVECKHVHFTVAALGFNALCTDGYEFCEISESIISFRYLKGVFGNVDVNKYVALIDLLNRNQMLT